MQSTWRALSRLATGIARSRFAKPAVRIGLAGSGLVLLAFIGRTTIGGALASSESADGAFARPQPTIATAGADASPRAEIDGAAPKATATLAPAPAPVEAPAPPAGRVRASADDPVVLNTATEADLKRLSGIGPKRAEAILALRARLGRFHALEDLLKVKGIGRATLKRLRPMLRVD